MPVEREEVESVTVQAVDKHLGILNKVIHLPYEVRFTLSKAVREELPGQIL